VAAHIVAAAAAVPVHDVELRVTAADTTTTATTAVVVEAVDDAVDFDDLLAVGRVDDRLALRVAGDGVLENSFRGA
jgi:hypothetical protein